jgi:hypothetical protein
VSGDTPVDPIVRNELLPACAVRVEIGEQHAGSGFFAAPGCVVTCEHVLSTLRVTSGDATPDVRVCAMDGSEYEMVDLPTTSLEEDLAVLRIKPADTHPCALLAPGLLGGDELVTFGAPEGAPGGVPTELRAEGETTETPRRTKLSQGQVRPGMSGSPVLNLRTGGICGVLKRTRDPTQALGGYAIPIQALFKLSRSLERNSLKYHEAESVWYEALPPRQQKLMRIGRPAAAAPKPTRFFVVTVRQGGLGWQASAVDHPSGDVISEVDVDLSVVRQDVARVFRYWARRGRGDPTDETRRLGSILAAVLPEGIRAALDELVADTDSPLELVLRFEKGTDPDLVLLPWENLFLGQIGSETNLFVARGEKPTFVRAIDSDLRKAAPTFRRNLDVLLIDVDHVARPAYQDGEEEAPASCVQSVCDALERMGDDDKLKLSVERLISPTASQIAAKLRESPYDIVHYVGYGRFVPGDPSADELALGGEGDSKYVDATMFKAALAETPPKLVVMQVCDGPDDAMPADPSTFAPQLLTKEPTGAVVAYQFPLNGRMSRKFNEELYPRLLAGESIGTAVQSARRALWMANGRSRAFLSPSTLLRQPGEFPLTAPSGMSTTIARTSVLTSYA